MPSDIDIHLAACFMQLGRLRLFIQFFEDELRDEFVFSETTQASWHDGLALLRIAAGPLDSHADVLREEPAESGRTKYSAYLAYFHQNLDAVDAETAHFGASDGGAAAGKRKPVERLFAALARLVDARYALSLWMESFVADHVTPCSEADANYVNPAIALGLECHWQDAERRLHAFRGDADEAGFRLHLIGRKIFLTALAFAVVDPDRFQASAHSQGVRYMREAVSSASSEFHRGHLQNKLSLLEKMSPRQFETLSIGTSAIMTR